jgi:AcrR family transcriptional regulator
MDVRERLVDAAETLIARHGVQGFSLREAARAVELDPAMVFRHFEDREDLVRAVASRGLAKLARAMVVAGRRAGAGGAEGRLRLLGQVYVRFALREGALFRVMFGPDRGPPLPREGTPFGLLVECLEALAAERGLGLEPTQAAALCWAGVHGVAMLALDGALARTAPMTPDRLTDLMLDALLGALR